MGNVVPLCIPLLVFHLEMRQRANCVSPFYSTSPPGCVQKWETVSRELLTRRGRAQASVRDSVRVSSGGSCCTSGTTMPRWSFSKDCFIWSRSVTEDCRICCHLLS